METPRPSKVMMFPAKLLILAPSSVESQIVTPIALITVKHTDTKGEDRRRDEGSEDDCRARPPQEVRRPIPRSGGRSSA